MDNKVNGYLALLLFMAAMWFAYLEKQTALFLYTAAFLYLWIYDSRRKEEEKLLYAEK